MSQAFKRRGNMSFDDSRAGNATRECASVWNRVRVKMRIVCLIAVGAFLLTIAVAEGDVPMGTPQYPQRVIRPIILEPVKRYYTNEDSPLSWFFKMVSRAVEPPKKTLPTMIGPLNLPGMSGQVFIRQVDNPSPWGSNHVVIRMVTRDPVTGLTLPMDTSGMSHNRPVKPYNHQPIKHPSARTNSMIQQGFVPSSVAPAYTSWSGQNRQHPQQYSPSYPKPQRPSLPNDFRYGNYGKQTDQSFVKQHPDSYPHRRPFQDNYQHFQPNPGPSGPATSIASPSVYQPIAQQVPRDHDYNAHRFKDTVRNANGNGPNFYNDQTDSSGSSETPYPEYPSSQDDELRSSISPKYVNESHDIDDGSDNNFQGPAQYRPVVRADRMVPVAGNHRNNFVASKTRTRMAKSQDSRGSKDSGGFRSAAKFDSEDVGGIEVIAAPNLKSGWENDFRKSKVDGSGSSESPSDSDGDLNQGEDSMSMRNGRNLARGESAEHVNEEPEMIIEKPAISRRLHSRMSLYSTINRARRRQAGRNSISTTERSNDESSEASDRSNDESSETSDRSNDESSEASDRSNDESSEASDRSNKESSEALDRFSKESSEALDRFNEEPSEFRDRFKKESSESLDRLNKEPSESLDRFKKKSSESPERLKKEPSESLDRLKKRPSGSLDRFKKESSESLDRFNKESSKSPGRSKEDPVKSLDHSKDDSSESSEYSHRLNDQSSEVDLVDDKKIGSIDKNEKPDGASGGIGKVERTTRRTMSNVTSEVVQKVMKLSVNNRRRLPDRRRARLIKAIYRRKPRTGIIKSSRQSIGSKNSSETKSSAESSSDN